MHMVKAGVMENIYAHNKHIAEHVEETKLIRLEPSARPGVPARVFLEPSMMPEEFRTSAVRSGCNRSGPARVLPFKIRGQPIASALEVITC